VPNFELPALVRRRRPVVEPTRQQRRAADREAAKLATPDAQVGLWRLPGDDGQVVPDNRSGRRYAARAYARAQPESGAAEEAQPTEPRSGLGNRRSFASPPTTAKVKLPEAKAEAEAARKERRHGRWSLRSGLQNITELRAFGRCGAVRHDGVPTLNVKRTRAGNRATIGGLQHCGSVWVCPNCAVIIGHRRGLEIRQAMKKALDSKYSVAMLTFTMRHKSKHTLRDCWAALSLAWRLATGGKAWVKDQQEGGIFGWIKAVEVTYGRNGWHVHLHVMMFFDHEVDKEHAQKYGDRMWERWASGLRKRGFSCRRDVGLDVRMASKDPDTPTRMGEYFTKLAMEMTGGYNKVARGENITPMQMGDLAVNSPFPNVREKYRNLWLVWESASKARKQMAMSKGLKEWAGIEDLKDEELPELFDEDGQPVPDEAALILRWDTWEQLRKSPALACELLDVAEDYGIAAAAAWLDAHRLYWSWPPPGWCVSHNRVGCDRCGVEVAA
jgi:Replication protein